MEGLIFGGAYVRREICGSKSIGLACSGNEIFHFALFYFVFEGKFRVQAPHGGLDLEGQFNLRVFCVTILGGLYLEGLIHGGAYFQNFTVIES